MKRVIWIVLDSVGIGAMPDAYQYGDEAANTLSHVYANCGGLDIKHMIELGLGNIDGIELLPNHIAPKGAFGRLAELSKGKDTTTGHWEMIGIYTKEPFPTYPNGFPKTLINTFENKIKGGIIGNYPASGTQIIEQLGEEHMRTGHPIVYTSADSVFQIAAHEEIIPLERLYEICEIARQMLVGEHEVSRVIARPFVGEPGQFVRTSNRRDFAVTPPVPNLLTYCQKDNIPVIAIGKIEDIFAKQGISQAIHTISNEDGIDTTVECMRRYKEGIIFTNLVDFDMKWGHRNDYRSYGQGLEEFDRRLPEILNLMTQEDILIITADHGCDPTTKGSDHTREYVPLIVVGEKIKAGFNLNTRSSFADIGQTLCELFGMKDLEIGTSFLKEILK
ncbi:phosphopentomutase [Cellulosilyticum sp. I15G10I2]|uniref:phosphopentomutase n=1 Tax=Cellulosilyticum sp. I15G10I2 TaxID=1892843 RepID=UPI00085BF20C|nr:phosphopentomutase [Cellulosilyticum sp. I15G10I2]